MLVQIKQPRPLPFCFLFSLLFFPNVTAAGAWPVREIRAEREID